jgi:hypothetical protein
MKFGIRMWQRIERRKLPKKNLGVTGNWKENVTAMSISFFSYIREIIHFKFIPTIFLWKLLVRPPLAKEETPLLNT